MISIKKNVLFFLFLCTFAFSEEITQGRLKNGLCYYICPDHTLQKVSLTLVVKKPKELLSLPFCDPFYLKRFYSSTCVAEPQKNTYEFSLSQFDLKGALLALSETIAKGTFSEKDIEEMREEYLEDQLLPKTGTFKELLFEGDEKYIAPFFEGEKPFEELFETLFDPSQMALVITGNFDRLGMETLIENLFADLPNRKMATSFISYKHLEPIAVTFTNVSLDEFYEIDEVSEEETLSRDLNFYFYPLEASYRSHVLSDLFSFIAFEKQKSLIRYSIGRLEDYFCFPFEEIPMKKPSMDQFEKMKKELRKFYEGKEISVEQRCVDHFVLGMKGDLKPENGNLLEALDSLSFESLNDFMEKKIQNISIDYVF